MELESEIGLWEFDVLKPFNDNTELVMRTDNHMLMVKKIMSDSEYEVHKKLHTLGHKNLAKIFDVVSDNGVCTVLEEYVNGVTLEYYAEQGETVEDDVIIYIIGEVCEGLKCLHENKIIHRDITPSNIVVNANTVKIIDFDIARFVNEKARKDTNILGTEGYAAPEQFDFKQSTEQTDIYAVGALINYIKTGKTPDEETLSDNSALSEIIRKCTAFDPSDRYQKIDELLKELRSSYDGVQPEKAKKEPLLEKLIGSLPGVRSRHLWVKIVSVVIYIIVFIFIFDSFRYINEPFVFLGKMCYSIFVLVIPFFFISNYMSFQNKLFKKYSYSVKRTIFYILAALSIAVGGTLHSILTSI